MMIWLLAGTLAYAADVGTTCVAVPVPITYRADAGAVSVGAETPAALEVSLIPAGFQVVGINGSQPTFTVVVACRATTEADKKRWAQQVEAARQREDAALRSKCAPLFENRDKWAAKGWPVSEITPIPMECQPYDPMVQMKK